MATFVVCTRCGATQEIGGIDQLPKLWKRVGTAMRCPRCATRDEEDSDPVLDEEVIYPHAEDTLDEAFDEECTVCGGPCQGH
jgi:hypothetical protein